ncbi:MAG: polysaccharide deacetylase family protein [Bacteroidetes bacterium]|nr:polysaccharide deacetylase family protein [Bacteroidota bacterium]
MNRYEYIRFPDQCLMLIYSPIISNRLRYITQFIGRELAGTPADLTADVKQFQQYDGPKINYSTEVLPGNGVCIYPHGLLEQRGITHQDISCSEQHGYTVFFQSGGDFGFDVLAASFYLLSRYEEYLPHRLDMYGRYAHENSLAYRERFLDQPLVNTWIEQLRVLLMEQFPAAKFQNPRFTFRPTYDIDEAYSYKYKTWWRSAGAALKDLLSGKWANWRIRRNVLNGQLPDPFDAYNWMDDLHRPHRLAPLYFFLMAAKTGRYDRHILPSEIAMQTLIRQHAQQYAIGIHPSWQSGDDPLLITSEKSELERISQLKISSSRQHFIRFTLPETYRRLIAAGIKEDYSMGFGSINGFRASVASPFYWYDLQKEETTFLQLFPYCYMEANSYYEQKHTPAQALEEMQHYYTVVKKVNGMLITIWHNTFLGTDERFAGWRDVYRQMLEQITHDMKHT